MKKQLAISDADQKILLHLLNKYLPNTKAWAYGSRVTGKARPASDLDLVVFANREQSLQVGDLREAFEESDLTFRVDLFVWDSVPESFKVNIEKEHVVLCDTVNEALQEHVRQYGKVIVGDIRLVPFTSLLSHITDNRGKTCPTAKSGIPLIATNCITNDALYPSYDTERYVDQKTFENWFRSHPKPNDIIFVCKGSPGRVNITPDPVDFCIAQDMVAVRADSNKVYWKYLFAVLRSDYVQSQIKNMHVGTMIPHFKKGDFGSLQIPLPNSTAQRIIGDIYFNLSLRIHLLRETNATLEAMAQALFKSWFVDFDPVRAKVEGRTPEGMDAETAALFPSEFEESEQGMIPKGWGITSFADTVSILSGGTPKTTIANYWNGSIPWFSVVDAPRQSDVFVMHTEKTITNEGVKNSSAKILPIGTTIISARGTVGKLAITGSQMSMNQSCYGLHGVLNDVYFTYFNTLKLVGELKCRTHGSVFDTITRSTFDGVNSIKPQSAIVVLFENSVEPIMERIKVNLMQARTLTALRDTLLPRLISGKLRLPEFASATTTAAP